MTTRENLIAWVRRYRFRKKIAHLGSAERLNPILDVGCGQWPIEADVYADFKIPESAIEFDNKFVCCDVQNLPFADQAFNFVHCSNVLEHLPNPGKAFAELKRVASHGYIECPSAFRENILCHTGAHCWVIKFINGQIALRKPKKFIFLGLQIFPMTWLYRLLSKKRMLWKCFDFLFGDLLGILYVCYRW